MYIVQQEMLSLKHKIIEIQDFNSSELHRRDFRRITRPIVNSRFLQNRGFGWVVLRLELIRPVRDYFKSSIAYADGSVDKNQAYRCKFTKNQTFRFYNIFIHLFVARPLKARTQPVTHPSAQTKPYPVRVLVR